MRQVAHDGIGSIGHSTMAVANRRIGHKSIRERLRFAAGKRSAWNDSASGQGAVAVVPDCQGFGGLVAGALELRGADLRPLALAVTGAEALAFWLAACQSGIGLRFGCLGFPGGRRGRCAGRPVARGFLILGPRA